MADISLRTNGEGYFLTKTPPHISVKACDLNKATPRGKYVCGSYGDVYNYREIGTKQKGAVALVWSVADDYED